MAGSAAEDRVLSTLNADGTRRWLRPVVSLGRFLSGRRLAAYALIAVFTLIPYLKLGGKPLILLDVAARRFTLFGMTFLPKDTLLLAIFLVGVVVTIFLATALLGRLWCGWMCPQTVYMEFLYRPLERLFDGPPGRRGTPGRKRTPLRTLLKLAAFLAASLYLAHTFLAYFVGVEALAKWVRQSPFQHPVSFVIMAVTTLLMLVDFAWFREQTCIVACPYGRLQSVLLDRHSLIVGYDERRGEPRGPLRKQAAGEDRRGDCIDCGLCVDTCPTGIDIRHGLQMECVGCAQCIDACDGVMDKIKKPRGLIRYSSQARMAGESSRVLRPRVILYPLVLVALAAGFGFALGTRAVADVTLLRGMGNPFTMTAEGEVRNQARLRIHNRGDQPLTFRVELLQDVPARLVMDENPFAVAPGETRTEAVQIVVSPDVFENGRRDVRLEVSTGSEWSLETSYRLLGPRGAARAGR